MLNNKAPIPSILVPSLLNRFLILLVVMTIASLSTVWFAFSQVLADRQKQEVATAVHFVLPQISAAVKNGDENAAFIGLRTLNDVLPIKVAQIYRERETPWLEYQPERTDISGLSGKGAGDAADSLDLAGITSKDLTKIGGDDPDLAYDTQIFDFKSLPVDTGETGRALSAAERSGYLKLYLKPANTGQGVFQAARLLIGSLLLLFLGLAFFYYQSLRFRIEGRLQGLLRRLANLETHAPARHLLPLSGSTQVRDEFDMIAAHYNQLLLGVDSLQRKVKSLQEQIRRNETEVEQQVQHRTAEIRKLNERYLEQKFDARNFALKARQARWEADKANRDKTRFLAAASHDLRQPLHAMNLFLEALDREVRSERGRGIYEDLQKSLESMQSMFNSLLDISRLEAGVTEANMQPVAMQDIFDKLELLFRQSAEDKSLDLRILPSKLLVCSDPQLLEQIARNLLSNAIKYTEKGAVLVGCRREGAKVRFFVMDQGIGIRKSKQAQIFSEFVQLNNEERDRSKGIGLGLAIVKRACEVLDHEIRLHSVYSEWTRFDIILPRTYSLHQAQLPQTAASALSRFDGQKVLVLDDDNAVLLAMSSLLESWNLQPLLAQTVAEAKDFCSSRSDKPDLIISDYRLQNGASGIEAVQQLNEMLDSPRPALIITGETAPERIRTATNSGFQVMFKPVKPARLRALCQTALSKRAAASNGAVGQLSEAVAASGGA
ncbi:MAG: hybrid sensor histidine kinase/response regulator [unclassified Hahellaceae]|nr:hybrid sensor histidine kinase/response regulator [Hahellaceae bacterium]|tara:strand:- start:55845 stop:58004 length:2160 start_codon:yes stop_codon:yes gene_type:complete